MRRRVGTRAEANPSLLRSASQGLLVVHVMSENKHPALERLTSGSLKGSRLWEVHVKWSTWWHRVIGFLWGRIPGCSWGKDSSDGRVSEKRGEASRLDVRGGRQGGGRCSSCGCLGRMTGWRQLVPRFGNSTRGHETPLCPGMTITSPQAVDTAHFAPVTPFASPFYLVSPAHISQPPWNVIFSGKSRTLAEHVPGRGRLFLK